MDFSLALQALCWWLCWWFPKPGPARVGSRSLLWHKIPRATRALQQDRGSMGSDFSWAVFLFSFFRKYILDCAMLPSRGPVEHLGFCRFWWKKDLKMKPVRWNYVEFAEVLFLLLPDSFSNDSSTKVPGEERCLELYTMLKSWNTRLTRHHLLDWALVTRTRCSSAVCLEIKRVIDEYWKTWHI